MRLLITALALALLAGCGRSEPTSDAATVKPLAIDRLAASGGAAMVVRTTAIVTGGFLATAQSAYGANRSPPLSWTAVPGAGGYAVVIEDPDAPGAAPFVHWLIWNIATPTLPEGPAPGSGAVQGKNGADSIGYFGPRPPSGAHHYHIEVFALDAPLTLKSGASLTELESAMRGHVVGQGELVALYAAPR